MKIDILIISKSVDNIVSLNNSGNPVIKMDKIIIESM